MPKLVFVLPDGTETGVDARTGDSVMITATQNGLDGVVAECGGNLSCATCHVWVRDDFLDAVGPPGEMEDDMMDLATSDRRTGSRLSCQIIVSEELDGLTVEIPREQP
ncbi:(2Fe-2S)-binding protein [Prauserella sp. PE36]|uniref:2Fe-2S iron-sulfur cluster-binding protein n=1 Tax=Prauserella sp. PE36 TaxID=1504709 RepID=UPI000DE32FD2|nr:2Fe-2S iron-sulfur cluster-binding protein [Prauserella sp. PE36]RBM17689.1 (2Fe-2S)-binding protein [Prauserella sp. PE36]